MAYEYIPPAPDSLDCPICKQPLQDPVLPSECMHIFCSGCLTQSLSTSATCPIDRSPVHLSSIRQAPQLIRAMLDDLQVKCTTCEWTGRREDHLLHSCNTLEASIPLQPRTCEYCLADVTGSLAKHLLSCNEVLAPCQHAAYGCSVRSKQQDLVSHLAACPYESMKGLFARLEDRFTAMEEENTLLRGRVESLHSELSRTDEDKARLQQTQNEKIQTLENSIRDLSTALSTLDIRTEMQTMSESARLQEEIQAVRAGLQQVPSPPMLNRNANAISSSGMRMQTWQMMLENERKAAMSSAPLGSLGPSVLGAGPSRDAAEGVTRLFGSGLGAGPGRAQATKL